MATSVDVKTDGGSYPILINHGSWTELAGWISEKLQPSTAILCTDSNVNPLYAQQVQRALEERNLKTLVLECPAGEQSKSVSVSQQWWQELASHRVDRQAVVIAVGGGVVGDLAGFIASTHLRGLRFVQIPTTLLAQVDSSVGGKVGINLPQGKNLVGSFWQPQLVWIDTNVLNTLSSREFAAGMAEVVKYAAIEDAAMFQWLEDNASAINQKQADVIEQLIQRCCQIKADVVEADTRETSGRRAILNFGHTVGHAIEQLSGYGHYLHGEAISMGMVAETVLASGRGDCETNVVEDLKRLLVKFNLPIAMPKLPFDELVKAMQGDKKNSNSQIVFVLPRKIGQVFLCRDAELNSRVFG